LRILSRETARTHFRIQAIASWYRPLYCVLKLNSALINAYSLRHTSLKFNQTILF